jgi:hypothetical protein
MKKELRAYVIDLNNTDFDSRQAEREGNFDIIIDEAERMGNVYSLYGLQEAINNDEICFENAYVHFIYNTGEPIKPIL